VTDPRTQLQESIVVTNTVADTGIPAEAFTGPARLKKRQDREKAAARLRKQGWSYRRIAEALAVPYIMIGRWLSGDGEEQPPSPVDDHGEDTEAAAAVAAAAAQEDGDSGHKYTVLSLQFSAFEKYVRDVIGRFEKDRKDLMRRQHATLEKMEAEKAASDAARAEAEEAVKAMRAEIDSLRAELETFRDDVRRDLARAGGKGPSGGDDEDDLGGGHGRPGPGGDGDDDDDDADGSEDFDFNFPDDEDDKP